MPPTPPRPTAIDLFAGCGGLSLGAEYAGFEPVLAVEKSDMAAQTYYRNFHLRDRPEWGPDEQAEWDQLRAECRTGDFLAAAKRGVVVGDIWNVVDDRAIMEYAAGLKVDLVAGGPPCQGFSMAGRRIAADARNLLPTAFLKFVEVTNPRAVIVENVVGINRAFKASGGPTDPPFIQLWRALEQTGRVSIEDPRKSLDGPGYLVQPVEVNAKHFGVPQSRPRMMLLALRRDVAAAAGLGDSDASRGIWRSEDAWQGGEEPLPPLVPSLVRDGVPEYGIPSREALLDLAPTGGGYVARARSPFARAIRAYPEGASRAQQPPNHVVRKHTDTTTARFVLYQWLRDNPELDRNRIMRVGRECDDPQAAAAILRDQYGISGDIPNQLVEELRKPSYRHGIPVRTDGPLATLLVELSTKKHSQSAINPDEPAPTVVTLPDDHVHPWAPRIMTVRELARLQSFPDWFEFMNKETTGSTRRRFEVPQYSQVGNAVPPLMAQAVATRLLYWLTRSTN